MTNLKAFRGDDGLITLKFLRGEADQDITGWTVFFTMKKNIEDADDDADLKKDVTVHTSPTTGETAITWTDVEADDFLGVYYFDIQYKDDTGEIKTVMKGTLTFIEDVTRRIA